MISGCKVLTEIPSDVALSLKLLNWNFGTFRKQKYVPVLVPHFGLRSGTLRQREGMKERYERVGSDGSRSPP